MGGEKKSQNTFKVLRKLVKKENKTKFLVNLRVDETHFSVSVVSIRQEPGLRKLFRTSSKDATLPL